MSSAGNEQAGDGSADHQTFTINNEFSAVINGVEDIVRDAAHDQKTLSTGDEQADELNTALWEDMSNGIGMEDITFAEVMGWAAHEANEVVQLQTVAPNAHASIRGRTINKE